MIGALALGTCVCGALLPCPCRHLIVHPHPQQGCGECPQPAVCRVCHLPDPECGRWVQHGEVFHSLTTTWRLLAAYRGGVA